MRAPSRLVPSLAMLALLLLPARQASAKEGFVDIIATQLALPYLPPCRLCHIQGTTGPGSVQAPFGVSMLAHGLTEASVTVGPDSDGDGHPDVAELTANTDPNTAAAAPLAPGDPTYGCAVAPASTARARPACIPAIFALFVGLAAHRRRRPAKVSR